MYIYNYTHRERESVCVCYILQATMVTAQLCSFDPQAHTSQELVNTSPGTTDLAQAPTKGLMINCLNFDSEESRNKPDCWIDFITFKRAQSVHSCYQPKSFQWAVHAITHPTSYDPAPPLLPGSTRIILNNVSVKWFEPHICSLPCCVFELCGVVFFRFELNNMFKNNHVFITMLCWCISDLKTD